MRAMSSPSPCSGRRRDKRRRDKSGTAGGDRARRLHHVRPRARGDRRSPHLARPELGLARRRARAHLRAAGAAQGATELHLPDRGRDRGRQDGRERMRRSAWSRTVWPRATTGAIPTESRSTCVAGRCWTRRTSTRRSRPVTETPRTCSANFVIGAAGGRSSMSRPAPTTPAGSSRGRHHHPFEPFPVAGPRRVAAGEDRAQHALSR